MDTDAAASASGDRVNVVTGAFGFSGRHIAERLLAMGEKVRTLTMHPDPESPLSPRIETAPLNFEEPQELTKAMSGADVLYNTYWVRFARGHVDHELAARNSRILIRAAEDAGVKRIVHVSITNPSPDSPLPYFRGKAEVEKMIQDSTLSYAILRPAVLFGDGDILINNITWFLRRFPLFAVPGFGFYSLRPIHVDDLARLAVDSGHVRENSVVDAVGPEQYTYDDLVRLIRDVTGTPSKVIHLPATLVCGISRFLGLFLGDVVLTKDEIAGLTANLLASSADSTGDTSLREWLSENAHYVGAEYASELKRHYAS